MALVDALGNLVRFDLLPGQRHESLMAEPLLQEVETQALLADMAFDTNALRHVLDERGIVAVIPSKPDRKVTIPHDETMYGWRHLVENMFAKLKQFRRIATRYDKTLTSYTAMLHLAACAIALR